ncbi:MAG TPA: hypothetical protein VF459_09815 [Caulobacteraceae bacterium]
MTSADQCRKRANRLLRRAAKITDPEARGAVQAQARSWMSLARVARWGEFFVGEESGSRILN